MAKSPLYKYDPNDPNQKYMAPIGSAPTTAQYAQPTYTAPADPSMYDWLVSQWDVGVNGPLFQGDKDALQNKADSSWFANNAETQYDYNKWLQDQQTGNYNDWYNQNMVPWQQNQQDWNQYNTANQGYNNWLTQTGAMRNAVNAQNQSDDLAKAQERANRFASRGSKYTGSRSLYGNMTGA